jgi:predicted metalloprotease with PDZ domain
LVNEVHPDLQNFFTQFVEGKNQWKPNEQLNYVGITYHDSLQEQDILSIFTDNDVKHKANGIGIEQVITKVGPNEWAGLKVGDIINISDYREAFVPNGVRLKEGELAKLRVKRGKEFVTLDIKAKYGLKTVKHALRWTGK